VFVVMAVLLLSPHSLGQRICLCLRWMVDSTSDHYGGEFDGLISVFGGVTWPFFVWYFGTRVFVLFRGTGRNRSYFRRQGGCVDGLWIGCVWSGCTCGSWALEVIPFWDCRGGFGMFTWCKMG
jgi:hypothetical protein